MKLLLTSGGLRNPTLIKALLDLVAKPASELKIAFIPTAMNIQSGDKGWVIAQLVQLQKMGVAQVDIVDISAISKDVWLPRLEESNVLFVNGGNTTHLMACFNESGLTKELPKLLETRVYVGVSAGTYVATPDTRLNSDDTDEVLDGLNLVDFGVQAHYKSSTFPLAESHESVAKRVKGCPYTVYALDDQMAVKVNGDEFEVIGEGEYVEFTPISESNQ